MELINWYEKINEFLSDELTITEMVEAAYKIGVRDGVRDTIGQFVEARENLELGNDASIIRLFSGYEQATRRRREDEKMLL